MKMSKPGGLRNQKRENITSNQNRLYQSRGSDDRAQLGSSPKILAKRLKDLRRRSLHHALASSSISDDKITSNRELEEMKKYVAELKSSHAPLHLRQHTTTGSIKALHSRNHLIQSSMTSLPISNIGRHDSSQVKLSVNANAARTNDIAKKVNTLKRILRGDEQGQPQIDPRSEEMIQDSKPPFRQKSERNLLVPSGQKYQMDYASIAKQYKAMEQYRCDSPLQQMPCVICKTIASKKKSKGKEASKRNFLSKVLFPCEHLCICDTCFTHQFQWRECPLCRQEIKVVFPYSGRERDEYFDWVNEIKPPLPPGFAKAFAVDSKVIIADYLRRSIEDLNDDDDYGVNPDMKGMLTSDDALQSQACVLS